MLKSGDKVQINHETFNKADLYKKGLDPKKSYTVDWFVENNRKGHKVYLKEIPHRIFRAVLFKLT